DGLDRPCPITCFAADALIASEHDGRNHLSSWVVGPLAWCNAGGAHHIDNTGREAEQQKYNKPPWRDAKPAVEHPTERGAKQHTADQIGRESKPPRKSRRVGGHARV